MHIDKNNLWKFAYTNEEALSTFRGIVVNFHGLNRGLELTRVPDELSAFCSENHLLYVFPYLNPWSWMNSASIEMTDQILDALWQAYQLPAGFPLCLAGRSMGGQCALIYGIHGKYPANSCALNCPVCDLHYHYDEREDVPRTIFSAFCGEAAPEAAFTRADPMAQQDLLPRISYFIAHCECDSKVSKAMHSDRLVAALKKRQIEVEYLSVPDRDHIDLSPEAYQRLFSFIRHSLYS